MTVRKIVLASGLLMTCLAAFSQKNPDLKCPVKFGKITPEDFNLSAAKFDTAADAVVIADVGSTYVEGNSKGWFSLVYRHSKRIKILKRNGIEDAAQVEIPLFTEGTATELLSGLKAVTYNLEGGKVVETKLDDKSIFTNKVSKNIVEKKFSFPSVKEGSIIEFTYTQYSDFLRNFQPWAFQGAYPCLWSEYEVSIPNFLQYATLSQGYLAWQTTAPSSINTTFHVVITGGADRDDHETFDDIVTTRKWAIRDVPALKPEAYTTTIGNYVSKIEFQLSGYAFPNTMPKDIMGNWYTVSKELMKDDQFGADLNSGNGWLDDDMKTILQSAGTQLEKAKKIYAFIRDNFTCTEGDEIYGLVPIKTVFKERHGNEASLNLLLVAMLNHAHIHADPVILSTRDNGFVHNFYPLLSRFNYVVARALIDSAYQFLDASNPWNSFGHLPGYCYNGLGRVINQELPSAVAFNPDSLKEAKLTFVFIGNEGKGVMSGNYKMTPGFAESRTLRERIHKEGEKGYFKSLQQDYSGDVEISNTSVDSMKMLEMPIGVSYDFKIKNDTTEDLIYFNPMLSAARKENPFKAAERVYPVEMNYAVDETYVLSMDTPEGYDIDELPKSAKVALNDDEGFFEYMIGKTETGFQFRCRIQLKKANFKPEDYGYLRDFFGYVVKKESEQVVFKKIKS